MLTVNLGFQPPFKTNPNAQTRQNEAHFAGSCCGGKKKQPVSAPANHETKISKSEPVHQPSASAKQTPLPFWQKMRGQIKEWFQQFFSILKTDLKALFMSKK
ncbi:hypothetical protein [Vampirovibrio sp.]|uniref:hypothetical protein n=1 Tax=Vampirovibrio sp. TaxID=2717857 RepID=UPI003593A23B